ncbi:MAG: hypothetical protein R3C28_03385 [Pirellulaceae bacterium]
MILLELAEHRWTSFDILASGEFCYDAVMLAVRMRHQPSRSPAFRNAEFHWKSFSITSNLMDFL